MNSCVLIRACSVDLIHPNLLQVHILKRHPSPTIFKARNGYITLCSWLSLRQSVLLVCVAIILCFIKLMEWNQVAESGALLRHLVLIDIILRFKEWFSLFDRWGLRIDHPLFQWGSRIFDMSCFVVFGGFVTSWALLLSLMFMV